MKNSIIFKLTILLVVLQLFTSCSFLKKIFGCDQPSSNENMVTISPNGGEYTLQNGLVLKVPANAVDEKTDISIKLLNNSELQPILDKYELNNENVLAYIEGKPDGQTFNVPIELTFPASFEDGDISLLYEIINDTSCVIASNSKIRLNSDQNQITISISHFSSFFTSIISKLKDMLNIECLTTPCRCRNNEIIQGDKDYICNNGDCQITEMKLNITFPDCTGSPREDFFAREVSEGCAPELVISADSYIVETTGQTNINATVKLGCEPVDKQDVDFSKSGSVPAIINPTNTTTDNSGSVKTDFKAGDEEGNVQVHARSTVSYYNKTISASAGGTSELNQGPLITEPLDETINIEIKNPIESWSGTMKFNIWNDWYSTGYIQTSEYQVDFHFFVYKYDGLSPYNIYGKATSTQKVDLVSTFEYYWVEELNVPPSLNFDIRGNAKEDGDTLRIGFFVDPSRLIPAWDCILCCDYPDRPKECWERDGNYSLPIHSNPFPLGTCSGNVYLREETFMEECEYFFLLSQTPKVWRRDTYTITLHKDE